MQILRLFDASNFSMQGSHRIASCPFLCIGSMVDVGVTKSCSRAGKNVFLTGMKQTACF